MTSAANEPESKGRAIARDDVEMVALRSRRLEALFGVSLGELRAPHVQSLVDSSTQESFDLEFQGEHYGRTDSARRDIAGDVAALANTAGGLIIIGVKEDAQARAVGAPGVELSGVEVRRIEQAVAGLVSPVPVFEVSSVPLDPDPNHRSENEPDGASGFIVIAVARSAQYPHAVLVNDGLRFPKRNGSTIRYLSEPEVAAAYRDRLGGWEQQARRVAAIEHDTLARLDTQDSWAVVTLVPDMPGDIVISQAVFSAFRREMVTTPVRLFGRSTVFTRSSTGRRRLLADGSANTPLARYGALDLHTDGAGVYATNIFDLATQTRGWERSNDESPEVQLISDDTIVASILSGLLYLARHARDRAAPGGGVIVRAQLYPMSEERPIQIGHGEGFPDPRNQQILTTPPAPAETAAALDDLVQPGPKFLAVACRLVDELGQAFGVAEMGHLSPAGELRLRYWGASFQSPLTMWAIEHGITVTNEVITTD